MAQSADMQAIPDKSEMRAGYKQDVAQQCLDFVLKIRKSLYMTNNPYFLNLRRGAERMKCQKSGIFERVRKKQGFFQTKAQGLPITTIIIAALALVVLVILFAIFTGRISIFGRGITECPGRCALPYSQTGEQPMTEGRTELDPDAQCNPQFEKALTGIYIASDQPPNTPADKLVYCSKCCVSIV